MLILSDSLAYGARQVWVGKVGDPLDDLLCLYSAEGEQVQKGIENRGLVFTSPGQAAWRGTVPRIPLQRLKLVLILITELSQWKPTSLTWGNDGMCAFVNTNIRRKFHLLSFPAPSVHPGLPAFPLEGLFGGDLELEFLFQRIISLLGPGQCFPKWFV